MDGFGDVDSYPSAADAYDQHISDALRAEQLGYGYYFFIEHQNAPFAYISSPSVYLAALARGPAHCGSARWSTSCPCITPSDWPRMRPWSTSSRGAAWSSASATASTRTSSCAGSCLLRAPRDGRRGHGDRPQGLDRGNRDLRRRVLELRRGAAQAKAIPAALPAASGSALTARSLSSTQPGTTSTSDRTSMSDQVAAEKFAYFRECWKAQGHPGPMPKTLIARHVHVAESDATGPRRSRAAAAEGLFRQRRGDDRRSPPLESASVAIRA